MVRGFYDNPDLLAVALCVMRLSFRSWPGPGGWGQRGRRGNDRPARGGENTGVRPASRPQVIASLDRMDLLPAITFIFSRAGCEAAVAQCVSSGLWLTTETEQRIIAQRVDEAGQDIPADDLDVLGFWTWRDGLLRGFAAHHAGMLPTFKEVVEKLFADGLVKAVFATETLALGVNMPARSVVLEKLDKFNGEAHVDITAGEYTQLTGRAGRRGIDV
jgi:ATP-dependent RNA helicase HelY